MKLTLKIAKILIQLIKGKTIANSTAKSKLIDDLVAENIIFRSGKHKKYLQLVNEKSLHMYLANQLQIKHLNKYILALEKEDSSRADFVKITTDSKNSKERTFKGFLVNCYHPIKATLNNKEIILQPSDGSFTFMYDYETFKIPPHITVIGVENASNFRHIQAQKHLFRDLHPLFISRYPQSQHKDFIKWMQSTPNTYLHFGDFDIAGIGIYLNEYKKHLLEKATFFIPKNITEILKENGNRERFNKQKLNFKLEKIQESKILDLIEIIQLEKKGLDQEYFII
ncbi:MULTISPECIES: hypothetical protein [unclassified Polaribacter]|uniref:DUF7281 domain-containing protein n=1 Tax=unclassified Polaribacter TaxID=196858 RepID=UPI0011BF48A2|nr:MULTISPECIES: hypothetical protein [unclassified Polaribacter]TXD53545.1 hypothetical protein ES043_03940 [Polaribacter sp. IC063]TXD58617.1 hypothetical protein ES044_11905 [Polaribacter sp. IC066]